ncbi:MAG: AsmA-like C-terminal domain-containing protein [Candidatus Methylomirabilia bacterium]
MSLRGWITGLLILIVLAGTVVAGLLYLRTRGAQELIRTYLETTLSEQLGMPVKLGSVEISPTLGRVRVLQAALLDPETGDPILEVGRLTVGLALNSLLRREVRVQSVGLSAPRLLFVDSPRHRARVLELLAGLGGAVGTTRGNRFPVSVDDGRVRYESSDGVQTLDLEGLRLTLWWEGSGRTSVSIAGESRLQVGDREVGTILFALSARVARDQWEVSGLRLSSGSSALQLRGMVRAPAGRVEADLAGEARLALEELGPLLLAEGGWRGGLTLQGRLQGAWPSLAFDGTLTLTDGVVAGMSVGGAEGSLSIRPGAIELVALSGRIWGGELVASGSYDLREGRYRGQVKLREVSLEEGLRATGWPWRLAGRMSGVVEGSGDGRGVQGLNLRLDLLASKLRFGDGEREAEMRLTGRASGGVVELDPLIVSRGKSRVSAHGRVDLRTEALALTVAGIVTDLGRDLWPRAVRGLGGRLAFSGRLGRTLKAPAFSGRVKGQRLSYKRARLDAVEGPLSAEPGRIASSGLKVTAGRSVGVLAGEVKLPDLQSEPGSWRESLTLSLKLDGNGTVEDVARRLSISLPVAGPFALHLTARGTPKGFSGSGRVEAPRLRVGPERLESIKARLRFNSSRLVLRSLTGDLRGIPFRAEGHLTRSGRYRVALAPVRADLTTLSGLPELEGTAILTAEGEGHLSAPQMKGELVVTGSRFHDFKVEKGALRFALGRGEWRWELALDNAIRGRGTAPLALKGRLKAELSVKELDLAPFRFFRQLRRRLREPLVVRADASAKLQGDLPALRNLSGRIELTAVRCQLDATPCRLRAPAGITVEGRTLRFDPVTVVGPGLSVTMTGSVRPGDRVDLEFQGRAPIPLVKPWVRPLEDVRGIPEGRVALAGPPKKLRVTGRAELREIAVKLKRIPIWFGVTSGEVHFTRHRVQYLLREGGTAGGRLEGDGSAFRVEGKRWRHTVELKLDQARVEELFDPLPALVRKVSGQLSLRESLTFETAPGLDPFQTLNGLLSMRLEGGSFSEYPALVRLFGLLSSAARPTVLPDLSRERMPFRHLSADFTIANGVMETRNLVLDSKVVRVSGIGTIALAEKRIDLKLAVRPLQVLEGGIRRLPLVGRLLPKEQSLSVVYVNLKGPWAEPKVSTAAGKSLGQTVVDLLLLLLRAPDRLLMPR